MDPVGPGPGACAESSFAGTFDALQTVVFEGRGCTQDLCHGSAASGGLDLRAGAAYGSLFDVKSASSTLKRVEPGDKDRSLLWLKLAAGTRPGSVAIPGAPMPSGLPPISENELEAIRLWIYSGAPQVGTVIGTASLLDACLPEPVPLTMKPLEAPLPDEGVQFTMPPVFLPAASEQEICFATYFNLKDQVPRPFQNPAGTHFRYSTHEIRQDPQSHHLALLYSGVPVEKIHDPSFGEWRCHTGERDGEICEPTDLAACGSGYCRSRVEQEAIGCVGYGPATFSLDFVQFQIGGAQEPQGYQELHPGVFAQVPLEGILYWSSHAFNLTSQDHVLNGRINFWFADDQRYPVHPVLSMGSIWMPDAAPFTEQTFCSEYVFPQGARVFQLSSHTHKRGKHFAAFLPGGEQIYENVIYNDPVKTEFDPPLAFDSPDSAQRAVRYCALYNNGRAPDGTPDPDAVTRWSRIPSSARATLGACTPVACVAGRLGASCAGEGDDASCDSSPDAGDGWCDACPITGGESTENEMFLLLGLFYVADGFPQPDDDGLYTVGVASMPRRSE